MSAGLDAVFGALADPIRRAILARLAQGECSVSMLAEPFAVSLPAISKHLRVLESSGLITRRIEGRVHRCRFRAEELREASEWIKEQQDFWETQFQALARYLEQEQS
ncbi:MAG: winged helix-turn-helix transcriptional regulator [Acidobacteriia bacterium]|nr:winged helix-turn-helix transcriptional regulator [Terriglobia bacterium]